MWVDQGTYWLSTVAQGTEEWLKQRVGRLTASQLHYAIMDPKRYLREKENPQPPNDAMIHGTLTEPEAREWYCNTRGVTVEEVGIAIPKWNLRLGASADGVTSDDGLIEIKCPKIMYREILDYLESPNREQLKLPVKDSHYTQIQCNLAVYQKSWCDYIVFCTPEAKVFTCRVPFDREYWLNIDEQTKDILPLIPSENLILPS